MPAYNKFDQFVEDAHNGVHNLGADQLVLALSNVAPVAGDAVLADLTEISYANLSSRDITTISSDQIAGTYRLILDDLVLTATGAVATFRYVAVYNDIPAGDPLIGWYDHGSEVDLTNGQTFTSDFDAVNGLFGNV